MAQHTYRITYNWQDVEGKPHVAQRDIMAATPVSALNMYHRFMQKEAKPTVPFDRYQITAMGLVFYDHPENNPLRGREVVSKFDLPQAVNPDLSCKNKTTEPIQLEMDSIP